MPIDVSYTDIVVFTLAWFVMFTLKYLSCLLFQVYSYNFMWCLHLHGLLNVVSRFHVLHETEFLNSGIISTTKLVYLTSCFPLQVTQDRQDLKETKVSQVPMERKVIKDLRDQRDNRALRDPRDHGDQREILHRKVLKIEFKFADCLKGK